ncbi:hypothetical protein NA56DRAFT_190843 [Hyaloscypha hepaticicola]|uniref:CorA-like transporter domain-containing protein n=1 Tax=Hyaloscypha hepaticicola TaxID=2082293 RepID=A0A2J6Q0V3_9HELO|nr:hypothetical protein NA56DRAFT_190843 [Hyaloscypha hepaticicola]
MEKPDSKLWESSPWSSGDVSDPYAFDIAHYTRLLVENSKRLFVQDDQLWIKVMEIGHRDIMFKSSLEFEAYLRSPEFKGTRLILIPQRFSWDNLLISESGLKLLLSRFNIFPAFLDVVNAFGAQTSSESDSISTSHTHVRANISECCYVTRHVDDHAREESEDSWSIRQMGVYHQRNVWSNADTFIILNPSKTFLQRLKDAQTVSGRLPTWRDIHILAASCATTPWRRYISYMESKLAQLKTKAHLSAVAESETPDTRPKLKIEFADTQNTGVIHDKLHKVDHILGSNLNVFSILSTVMSGRDGIQAHFDGRDNRLAFCTNETEMQQRRVNTLFQRINAASGLMQNIIDFRGLEALKTSSEMSTELSRLAQKNAEKSQKDARTITTITIFTMIYLPASFVSVSSQISWHALRTFKTTDRARVFKAIFKYGIR